MLTNGAAAGKEFIPLLPQSPHPYNADNRSPFQEEPENYAQKGLGAIWVHSKLSGSGYASSPAREAPGEGRPKGELLPEPILVALAQVAGASVLAGVLDAGVDGRGAVFALRSRRGRSAWLGRLSMAERTQEIAGSSRHPLGCGWGGGRGPWDSEKSKGRNVENSGVWVPVPLCPGIHTLLSMPNRRQSLGFGTGRPGFTVCLYLSLVG